MRSQKVSYLLRKWKERRTELLDFFNEIIYLKKKKEEEKETKTEFLG